MLVLSRRVGEKVLVGENVTVVVAKVKEGVVKLGFEAPREVPIVRSEIANKEPQKWQP